MNRPRETSDEDILEAARECFLKKGPSASTAEIASKLGVSAQALLKRFGSKHNLMIAALAPAESDMDWTERISKGPDSRPLAKQLTDLAFEIDDFFEGFVQTAAVLQMSEITPQELMEKYDTPPPLQGIQLVSDWFRRAELLELIAPCDFESTALAFIGAIQTRSFLRFVLNQNPTTQKREKYLENVAHTFAQGLIPRSKG